MIPVRELFRIINLFTEGSTGFRTGELYALKQEDLDFEKKLIYVTKFLSYQKFEEDIKKTFNFGNTKSKLSCDVPINRQCELTLKKTAYAKKSYC